MLTTDDREAIVGGSTLPTELLTSICVHAGSVSGLFCYMTQHLHDVIVQRLLETVVAKPGTFRVSPLVHRPLDTIQS
jgi:hypothetical protein